MPVSDPAPALGCTDQRGRAESRTIPVGSSGTSNASASTISSFVQVARLFFRTSVSAFLQSLSLKPMLRSPR